jgi:hypothetical protein
MASFDESLSIVLDFLSSKSFSSVRDLLLQVHRARPNVEALNQYTSELEKLLDVTTRPHIFAAKDTPPIASADVSSTINAWLRPPGSTTSDVTQEKEALVVFQRTKMGAADGHEFRNRRGLNTIREVTIFHEPHPMPEHKKREVVHMALPLMYNPNRNGLEDSSSLQLVAGSVVAGR